MNPPSRRPRIFVSYARSDGEALARDLGGRLAAAGLPPWRDREGLQGGRDWWQQVMAAIDEVEFLVLVITPAAQASAMVRREWRYARQRGVTVYPVIGHPELDFAAMPHWMRSVHFYDLAHEWTRFVNDLQTTPNAVRVPFMVEDLPPGFVPRPAEAERLLRHLLDREREEPVAITAALRGAGGYGKTALARAVCHDEDVQNAFDDGILWVTLGENPGDLTRRVEDLILTLSGRRPGFTGLDAATAALVELLGDRDILMVIDDVWDAAHLQPFLQGGRRCARIITTRIADVLPPQAKRVQVDAMQIDEALSLVGQGLPADEPAALAALARRLGEWPMLLKLVNAALRDRVVHGGQPLVAALEHVNRALDKRGLTFFDARDAAARHDAVAKTLGLSIAQLDEGERARFAELAVFPEDVEVPLDVVAAYWQRTGALDAFDAEVLCERLGRLSLLLDFDPAARCIRLHDVVRHFLRLQVAERLPGLHAGLLEALRPPGGDWADLPVGRAYGWQWLFHHLEAAGQVDAMLATVLDLRYLAAKTAARSIFATEDDLNAVDRLLAAQPGGTPAALQALLRGYAQCTHLLARCDGVAEVLGTLFTRLQHLPELAALVPGWARALPAAGLQARQPLPDLPHPRLRRTLSDHRGQVLACAVSADGQRVTTAGSDRLIKVWDARTGRELLRLAGHTGWVNGLATSRDGRLLASASTDRRLRLWNLTDGESIATLVGHTDGLTDCALAPDGSVVVSASLDGSLKVWDTASGALRRTLAREWSEDSTRLAVPVNRQGHWSAVHACAISPDGGLLASASSDQTLIVWDIASGRALHLLAGHTAGVNACCFSPDGQWLASGGSDRSARLWRLADGSAQALLSHRERVNTVAFGAGGHLVCGLADGSVVVWDLDRGAPLDELSGHAGSVNHCVTALDGNVIVSTSSDGTARLWSPPDGHGVARAAAAPGWLLCCAAVSGAARVITGSEFGELVEWDSRTALPRAVVARLDTALHACAVSPSGALVAAVGDDRSVTVWDGPGGLPLHSFAGHRDRVNGCAIDPGGRLLATVGSDRSLRLWDLRTRARKLALAVPGRELGCCAFSADGRTVATGGDDGCVTLWSLDFDEALWERWLDGAATLDESVASHALRPQSWRPGAGAVNALAYTPDGRFLLAACSDHRLYVRRPDAAEPPLALRGHGAPVTGCAAHPSGPWAVSCAADGGLRLWDLEAARCLAAVRVDGALLDCAWAEDGSALLAAGAMGLYAFTTAGPPEQGGPDGRGPSGP
jgi:WD40 repeat protein